MAKRRLHMELTAYCGGNLIRYFLCNSVDIHRADKTDDILQVTCAHCKNKIHEMLWKIDQLYPGTQEAFSAN